MLSFLHSFFASLNDSLMRQLFAVSASPSPVIDEDGIRAMGFDPIDDLVFMKELAALYTDNTVEVVGGVCC